MIESLLERNKEELLYIGKRKFYRLNLLKPYAKPIGKKTFIDYIYEVPLHYDLGNTIEFHAGYIHTQSLASAIPPYILNPSKNDTVYDCCASPGSKTSQLAMIMRNEGRIIAVDKRDRIKALNYNLERLGVLNTFVTVHDAKKKLPYRYTKALVDVPCSSLGSHPNAWKRLNDSILRTLTDVQKRIISSAFEMLNRGGVLVYSTCTITLEENEAIIAYLLNKYQNARLEKIDLNIPYSPGDSSIYEDIKYTIRISAKDAGEAFFIAKIKKV
jgi:tRNA (cytosine40_48-C5)-methyltransferase